MAEKIVLAKKTEAEFTEKKSKFIAYCKHIETEEEAQNFVESIKKKNWDATHNVYAYVLGENNTIQRSSDDGEPSGTAGRPVLESIKSHGLSNTAIVVTRYFGGILLGTGGLVRAYSKSAQLGIEAAGKIRLVEGETVCLFMDYELLGKAENFLIREGYTIDHIDYQNNVAIYCILEKTKRESFLNIIKENFPQGLHYTVLQETSWFPTTLIGNKV